MAYMHVCVCVRACVCVCESVSVSLFVSLSVSLPGGALQPPALLRHQGATGGDSIRNTCGYHGPFQPHNTVLVVGRVEEVGLQMGVCVCVYVCVLLCGYRASLRHQGAAGGDSIPDPCCYPGPRQPPLQGMNYGQGWGGTCRFMDRCVCQALLH